MQIDTYLQLRYARIRSTRYRFFRSGLRLARCRLPADFARAAGFAPLDC
jgi:hypothetical protein